MRVCGKNSRLLTMFNNNFTNLKTISQNITIKVYAQKKILENIYTILGLSSQKAVSTLYTSVVSYNL